MTQQQKILVVEGPTASGKTALAIALAQQFGGEIVSADSMQIYRRLDIGTAKPTREEQAAAKHHMIDVAEPGEQYSVSRYVEEATVCVEDILARKKLPIVCGGTGLYIDALIAGRDFSQGGQETLLRSRLEEAWQREGAAAMMERLARVDPESAEKLHLNDKKRILRALEVFEQTGETISEHNRKTKALPPRYDAVILGLNTDPRQILYDRINNRVDQMLKMGLVEEARALYEQGVLEGTAAQAIGYKEMLGFLKGECSLAQAADFLRQKSRNYAKRQLTWFGKDPRVHWIVYNSSHNFTQVFQSATKIATECGVR